MIGSGNGMGRAISMAFARVGASIVVAEIRIKQEIEQLGGRASSFREDISKQHDAG